jgi:trigger factor
VNVTVENLTPCKKFVRIEVDAQKVDETFESVTKDFRREANLPGFRPGKAPVEMVLRKYEKEIESEVKRKLISDAYKKAIDEQKVDVLGYPDIEEIQFGRGKPLLFAARVETPPDFDLPEYKGIPVKREARTVTEEDVVRAIDVLRQSKVSFQTVERPVQAGDIAVVNYTGTSEGKPLTEFEPTAKGLTSQEKFWVEVGSSSFIPGFGEQLQGAKAGERRTVQIDFPPDFVTQSLAGKKAVYDVEIMEVKEKVLPAMDDTLARNYGAESLEKLREGVRRDLENELTFKQNKDTRNQIIGSLLNRVTFELPETAVAQETRNVVYDIVQQNTKRGIPREKIEQEKENIYTAATQSAKERVKIGFLLQKIAEKEDIKVSEGEINARILQLAKAYQIPPKKLADDLKKRNALIQIYDEIMNQKVLQLLEKEARIEEVPPGTLEPRA